LLIYILSLNRTKARDLKGLSELSNNNDMIKLYSGRILELAGNILLTEPLTNPQATASKRSPLCGSNITVSINVTDGKISGFSQDVKACALGQASASILAKHIIGLDRTAIAKGRDELFEMLVNNGPLPAPPFEEFSVLEPAKEYRNRHASIMLAFDATLEAFNAINQ
jgi:NifU-like protein involved in Fe-S cluster formation